MKKSLTWEQKNIVNHENGHALVKAVPGSGKTTTLIKRIERLVKSGVNRKSILILMYNKSAQLSFTKKLKVALKSEAIPEVRTFHSLALKIVTHGERSQVIKRKQLITNSDQRYVQLVRQAYQNGFENEVSNISSSDIEEFELFISRCRAGAVTPIDAAADPSFSRVKPEYIRAYSHYCKLLEENRLRTFDDCLIEAISLLRNTPNLTTHYKYIIVDEYQDVNLVQHDMSRLLAKPDTSVMAVGDINQCIYEWRGARPDFIGGLFEQHFKSTKVFHLSCTFRFGHTLSLMANSVIRRNSTKISKLCVSHPHTPKTDVKLHLEDCLSKVLLHLPTNNGTQAILSRTKANLAEAEFALRLCGLPYRYLDGSTLLHTRAEIGMLAVGVSLCVHGDLRPLENHPNKKDLVYGFLRESGFSWKQGQFKEALKSLMPPQVDLWAALRGLFNDSPYQAKRLKEIAIISQKDNEKTPAAYVLKRLIRAGFLEELGSGGVSRTGSNDQKRSVVRVQELLETSKIDAGTFLKLILHPKQETRDCESFVLSTLHGAKGLEWDNVVLIGLHETEFPGSHPDEGDRLRASTEELEEERRLFYVGITRAKQQLNLIVPYDTGLEKWLSNDWDSTPKRSTIATRFVYESGWTACLSTSAAIYDNRVQEQKEKSSKFHQWYLRDMQRLRV